MSELLSYSLDRLRKEPDLLNEERQHVGRSIQANALSHYDAFLDTASCSETVEQELTCVCAQLEKLLRSTPQLASACEVFSRDSAGVMEQHSSNKQLLGTSSHPVAGSNELS
eukprot:jgi/Chrzof1/11963/Cz06g16080.t1